MTWPILARDADGRFGVVIASRFFAAGALCVHMRRGVGALATQALMNPLYGAAGLDLLSDGRSAADVVRTLVAADAGRDHLLFENFSVAGNMLAGPQVIEATAQAYRDADGLPLAERLLAALAASQAAGGDKRGKQAAALRIHADEDHPQLDLRVDDHTEPIIELQRLYRVSLQRYQPFMACLAGRFDPVGLTDRAEVEACIEAFHATRMAGKP